MESASLSSLLAATVAFAIGTSVVLRDRSRTQNVRFAVFCFNLGLYHVSGFFFGFSGWQAFEWFAVTIALLLPWTADRLLASFVPSSGRRRWQPGSGLRVTLGIALVVMQTVSLIVPVIKDVQTKSVMQLAVELGALAERTREGNVSREELEGSTFTIHLPIASTNEMSPN